MKHTTRMGCTVSTEPAKDCIAIRITQPAAGHGRVDLFTCNRNDLIIIAEMLIKAAKEQP